MMRSAAMIDHGIDPTDRPEQLVARVVELLLVRRACHLTGV